MVFELVYSSVGSRNFDVAALDALLARARVRNAVNGVTGILLYRKGAFMQLLEGDEAAVRETYARIAGDSRHESIRMIGATQKRARSFAEWSMGYVSLGRALTVSPPPGAHALSSNGSLLDDDDADVLRILERFRNGEWSGQIR